MCFTDNVGEANFSELRSFDQITQFNFHRWNLCEQNANCPAFSFSKYLPIGKTLGENERKNANLSFCFWNWLSSRARYLLDLYLAVEEEEEVTIRETTCPIPPIPAFCILYFLLYFRSFVFCIFAWKRKRRRQSVRHRVLSGSIPFPLWGATSQRDPRQ